MLTYSLRILCFQLCPISGMFLCGNPIEFAFVHLTFGLAVSNFYRSTIFLDPPALVTTHSYPPSWLELPQFHNFWTGKNWVGGQVKGEFQLKGSAMPSTTVPPPLVLLVETPPEGNFFMGAKPPNKNLALFLREVLDPPPPRCTPRVVSPPPKAGIFLK